MANKSEEIFQLRSEIAARGDEGDNPLPRRKTYEILGSLLKSTVNAILVKGEPGSGKTTFALELLRAYGKGVYVSTRVSQEQVSEQHPYIKELIERGEVLDLMPDEKIQVKNEIKFEDLRLANAHDIIDIILQNVQKVWKPLILLDSWDAIAKELDPIERLKVEKTLLLIIVQNKAKILFISEEPTLTTTDYLVDAVVSLKTSCFDDRKIRRVELNKLRGSSIPQSAYLYSLDKARFTLFPKPLIQTPNDYDAKPFKPMVHKEDSYSTGSEDFDNFLGGGLTPSNTVVLEIGKFIGSNWQYPMIISMSCNFIANGGCVVSLPSGGVTPTMVANGIKAHVSNQSLDYSLKIGNFNEGYEQHTFMLDQTSISRTFETFFKEALKIKKIRVGRNEMPDTGRPCLYTIGIDAAESFFGPEDILRFSIIGTQSIKQLNDVVMMIVRSGTKSKQVLSDRCDLHLKLEEVDRSLVLYSVKPPSEIYNLQYDYRSGYPQIKLTAVN